MVRQVVMFQTILLCLPLHPSYLLHLQPLPLYPLFALFVLLI
ncbi:Uncharacterised protein [Escherichia coli]|nr:Uncharacterised protein [Escherichia coli]